MIGTTIACGIYIDETGFWMALAIFVLIKPLVYYAFIQAFRYRVSADIPLSFGRAFKLTLMRTGLGVAIFLVGAGIVATLGDANALLASSIFLYVARIGAWWFVGSWGAKLKGRRLLGWIISGWLINAAFDLSILLGAFTGYESVLMLLGGILLFLIPLHLIGRRTSLKARFTLPRCAKCDYSLIGNLSSVCPECGTPVSSPLPT